MLERPQMTRRAQTALNPDRSIVRFEFLEIIVRVAVQVRVVEKVVPWVEILILRMCAQKYIKSKAEPTAQKAVQRFFQSHLLPYAPREQDWKLRSELWTEEVRFCFHTSMLVEGCHLAVVQCCVFSATSPSETTFSSSRRCTAASLGGESSLGRSPRCLLQSTWRCWTSASCTRRVCSRVPFEGGSYASHLPPQCRFNATLTEREGRLAFVLAMMPVVCEMSTPDHTRMTFVEFLEAVRALKVSACGTVIRICTLTPCAANPARASGGLPGHRQNAAVPETAANVGPCGAAGRRCSGSRLENAGAHQTHAICAARRESSGGVGVRRGHTGAPPSIHTKLPVPQSIHRGAPTVHAPQRARASPSYEEEWPHDGRRRMELRQRRRGG